MINYYIKYILFFMISVQGYGQTLDILLKKAVEKNPKLNAVQMAYEASAETEKLITLSAPQLSFSIPVQRPETRLGEQTLMISASQMFPWFGTLKSKKEATIAISESQFKDISQMRLELFYRIKVAYYQLYLIAQKQRLIKRNIKLYQGLKNTALVKTETSEVVMSDVIRIQIKIDEMEHQIQVLELKKKPFLGEINALTNSNFNRQINPKNSLDTLANYTYDFKVFSNKIKKFHPMIIQVNKRLESKNFMLKYNARSGMPKIGLGLDYAAISPRTDAFPQNNGRDILTPKIMLSIPVFRDKYKHRRLQIDLEKKQLVHQKKATYNQLIQKLITYNSMYDDAKLQIELIKKQMVLTKSAYNILLSEYSGKGIRFDELLQLQTKLFNYDIDLVMASIQSYIAKANIDKLTDF